jgi:drug/metabolite transporter (DMT)-like permease
MTESRKNKISLAGFVITFIGAVLFSTKAIIIKKAFADIKIDALGLLTQRMIFSLPFYVVAALVLSGSKDNVKLTRRQWMQILGLGLFGYYLSSYLDFEGLQYVSAGLERLILFLYPTFVVLINTFFFRQKINRVQKTALLLTYAGIAVAYFGELQAGISSHGFLWGSLLIFLCAVTYAIYIVGSGKMIPVIGAAKFTAYAMLSATVFIFIHFALKNKIEISLLTGAGRWQYGLLLAIIATVIPTFLLSNGMKRIGSNNVAIISSIGPVSTIIQAHFFLGEKIFAAQIAGTLLVIAGVLLIGWKSPGEQG